MRNLPKKKGRRALHGIGLVRVQNEDASLLPPQPCLTLDVPQLGESEVALRNEHLTDQGREELPHLR